MFQTTVSNMLIMGWLFVYCFFGSLLNWKCGQVGEFAYHSKFYEYPMELKLFTLFMIERSQRPFFITGFRITKCSLESYAQVSISIFIRLFQLYFTRWQQIETNLLAPFIIPIISIYKRKSQPQKCILALF